MRSGSKLKARIGDLQEVSLQSRAREPPSRLDGTCCSESYCQSDFGLHIRQCYFEISAGWLDAGPLNAMTKGTATGGSVLGPFKSPRSAHDLSV